MRPDITGEATRFGPWVSALVYTMLVLAVGAGAALVWAIAMVVWRVLA